MESIDRWRNPQSFVLSLLSLLTLSTSAHAAWNINPNTLPEVRRLAHVIQMSSQQALQDAQAYSPQWGGYASPEQQQALNALYALTGAAAGLDQVLETAWPDPNQADAYFWQVSQDAQSLQATQGWLPNAGQDEYLLDQISQSAGELRMLHGNGGYPGPIPGPFPGPIPGPGGIAQLSQQLTRDSRQLQQLAAREQGFDGWKQNAVRTIGQLIAQADQIERELEVQDLGDARLLLQELDRLSIEVRQEVQGAGFSAWVNQAQERVAAEVQQLGRAITGGGVIVGPPVVVAPPVVIAPRPPVVVGPRPPVVVVHGPAYPPHI